MKNILIPTDFSDFGDEAFIYATDFVAGTKANFHIVHVISSDTPSPQASVLSAKLINMEYEMAKDKMVDFVEITKNYLETHPNIEISHNVLIGNKAMMIKDEAKRMEIDLIIMSTQGKSHTTTEKILGTISSGVIYDAPCPILLVPRNYSFKSINNIIFGTNLNHSEPFELWRATELLSPHTFTLRCVHVAKHISDTQTKSLDEFAKFMIENSPSIQTVFNVEVSDNVEDVIEEVANNHGAEMIIMHSSKKSMWKSFFGISHTKNMAFKTNIPLLIIDNRS